MTTRHHLPALILAGMIPFAAFAGEPSPMPPPPEPGTDILIPDLEPVLFAFDSAALDEASRAQLDRVVSVLERYDGATIGISGYACDIGAESYNQRLSERRASAVSGYLTGKGVDRARITTRGYGEADPPATDEEGRRRNRRVDMTISILDVLDDPGA